MYPDHLRLLDQMSQRTLFRIILVFFCLFSSLLGTNASSVLRLDPTKIVTSYGSSISVNCSTTATEYMQLDWEKSLGETRKTGPNTVTWRVDSLTEWDMEPSCYILFHTSQSILKLSLIVYKTPDSVSLSIMGYTGALTEGRQYNLKCAVQNVAPVEFLTVKWYKGETLVRNTKFDDYTKTPVNQLATIQITPTRDDDGAQYRCEAELDLGPDGPQPPPRVISDPLNITVYYGPEISCPSHITVKQSQRFTPNCTAAGHPTPKMTWYKDGVIVKFPEVMTISDAGQYVLIASSNISVSHTKEINHTMEIEVLYAPIGIWELNNQVIDQGYDQVLKCSSFSNPRPEYNWTYPQAANVRSENVDGVSMLYIDYATVQNTGIYTCTAFNDFGEAEKPVRIDVRDNTSSASISTVDHTGPMIEGELYDLRCDVQYVAPVHEITVHWYKGTTRVHSEVFPQPTESVDKTKKDMFAKLAISNNRDDNGTQYKCEAEVKPQAEGPHRFTITSGTLNITVHYKPEINTNKLPSVVPVFRGYPEVLVCEAEGYPQPTIKWTFKSITSVGGNYTILEASNESVGVYNCTASNSVESTVRVVKVILKEDYLPLIAGFVALVVVITSVFFIIIYSIYYKNTKMGRYMVEGAKPNAQNGNVAQNGKDSAIPMKKLSQNCV